MPSVHQHAGASEDYPNEHTKLVATKDATTLKALLRGLDDPADVREYIEAALNVDDPGRRKMVVGLANRRLDELG